MPEGLSCVAVVVGVPVMPAPVSPRIRPEVVLENGGLGAPWARLALPMVTVAVGRWV